MYYSRSWYLLITVGLYSPQHVYVIDDAMTSHWLNGDSEARAALSGASTSVPLADTELVGTQRNHRPIGVVDPASWPRAGRESGTSGVLHLCILPSLSDVRILHPHLERRLRNCRQPLCINTALRDYLRRNILPSTSGSITCMRHVSLIAGPSLYHTSCREIVKTSTPFSARGPPNVYHGAVWILAARLVTNREACTLVE